MKKVLVEGGEGNFEYVKTKIWVNIAVVVNLKHTKQTYLKSNFGCMMIYVFVSLKSSKCIKSVHERKSMQNKSLLKYQKVSCLNNSIKVDNRDKFHTIIS